MPTEKKPRRPKNVEPMGTFGNAADAGVLPGPHQPLPPVDIRVAGVPLDLAAPVVSLGPAGGVFNGIDPGEGVLLAEVADSPVVATPLNEEEVVAAGLMQMNLNPSPCPGCGAPEVPSNSPRTTYACGTSSYDDRPGTWRGPCATESKPTEGASLAGAPDGSVTPTMPVTSPFTSDGNVAGTDYLVTQVVPATAADVEHVIVEMRRPPTPEEAATRILAEDPRTALALYRRVSRGYGLAEWRPLGVGAQLVDLGTGDMLALVAPEGRRFVASYVESGTNLAGPTADTLDACKDAVGNRMRARGVGVL